MKKPNPGKSNSELDLVSKNILQRIVSKILNNSRYIWWKNSFDTTEQFKNNTHTNKTIFIQFVIIDFYPFITKELLLQCINLPKNYIDITKEELNIILVCRKSVLVYNNTTWQKKKKDTFDVVIGSFDSIQIADIVGVYILDTLGFFYRFKKYRTL